MYLKACDNFGKLLNIWHYVLLSERASYLLFAHIASRDPERRVNGEIFIVLFPRTTYIIKDRKTRLFDYVCYSPVINETNTFFIFYVEPVFMPAHYEFDRCVCFLFFMCKQSLSAVVVLCKRINKKCAKYEQKKT